MIPESGEKDLGTREIVLLIGCLPCIFAYPLLPIWFPQVLHSVEKALSTVMCGLKKLTNQKDSEGSWVI